MRTVLTTKGFDEYLEKLARAGKDIDAIADEALTAGAEILVKGMVCRAPERTGNLRRHIAFTPPEKDGNFHFTIVGLIPKKKYTDADTARYGMAQEFGTAHTSAHPFIRPTFDEDMKKARATMKGIFVERGAI